VSGRDTVELGYVAIKKTYCGKRLGEHLIEALLEDVKFPREQRNLRDFHLRGLGKVAIEFTMAAIAYNLIRARQQPRWHGRCPDKPCLLRQLSRK
jgi:hypothetical protein